MPEQQSLDPLLVPLLPPVRDFLAATHFLLIDNQWIAAQNDQTFTTYNPANGEALAQIASGHAADIDLAVKAARRAYNHGDWTQKMTPADRARLLWKMADLLEKHRETLAQLESLDNGKPYRSVRDGDVTWSADHFRYYAGWTTKIEGATIPVSVPGQMVYTVREPIGVCGLITPWNFPLEIAVWKLAPALACGNCVILKPAEQTPLSALFLGELFLEAGFPPGVVNIITGFGETAGAALINHPDVDKIGFTGSSEVARTIIHASAGTLLQNIKKVSLELGGKNPNIIFADADLSQAPTQALWAAFGNSGQSCVAGSRLYIERPAFDRVVDALTDQISKLRLAPGLSVDQPDLGPLISDEQMTRVLDYVTQGKDSGAKLQGGVRLGGDLAAGYFVSPGIFTETTDEMAIIQEEIFGPVVVATPFDDTADLIRRVNATRYGLAAGIWTRDIGRAHRLASAIKAGVVWINSYGMFDPAVPFGGYKDSGYGREMGASALDLYTQTKSVWVNLA
jgi:acyl-CoA reductase-like NAD-dependent aldehyde dehydrogenase